MCNERLNNKIKLLKQLVRNIKLVNFRKQSEILPIKCRTIWNCLKVILFVKNEYLNKLLLFPCVTGDLLFDLNDHEHPDRFFIICLSKNDFTQCTRENGENKFYNKEKFTIKKIKEQFNLFYNEGNNV